MYAGENNTAEYRISPETGTEKEWTGILIMNSRDYYKVFPSFYCDEKNQARS